MRPSGSLPPLLQALEETVGINDVAGMADRLIALQGCIPESSSRPGLVVWVTGLSGAGKSTVSAILGQRFLAAGLPVVSLDGDVLRSLFAAQAGHDREHRRRLALSYGALCREIAARGIHVVCATISMFHDVRDWNRANIERYAEIYLRVPLDELRRRDPKGLYAKADAGEIGDMVGVHLPVEEPRNADLVIDHRADLAPAETAALTLSHLHRHFGLDLRDRSDPPSLPPVSAR